MHNGTSYRFSWNWPETHKSLWQDDRFDPMHPFTSAGICLGRRTGTEAMDWAVAEGAEQRLAFATLCCLRLSSDFSRPGSWFSILLRLPSGFNEIAQLCIRASAKVSAIVFCAESLGKNLEQVFCWSWPSWWDSAVQFFSVFRKHNALLRLRHSIDDGYSVHYHIDGTYILVPVQA